MDTDKELVPLQPGKKDVDDLAQNEDKPNRNCLSSECLTCFQRQAALIYALFSAMCAVMVDILAFKVGKTIPSMEVPLWNAAGVTGLAVIATFIARPTFPKTWREISLVIMGGFLTGTGSAMLLLAIIFSDPGNAITLYFSMPVFATLMGAVVFRETPSCLQTVFVVLAVLGVTLVSGPSFLFSRDDRNEDNDYLLGLALGLGSAIVTSSGFVTYRQLSSAHDTPPYLPIFLQGVSGLAVSIILCVVYQQFELPGTTLDTIATTCNGLLSFTSSMALYFALKSANASYVTIAMTSEVLLSFIAQYLFFNLVPTWNSVFGAVVITVTCIGLALTKHNDTLPKEHSEQRAPLLHKQRAK